MNVVFDRVDEDWTKLQVCKYCGRVSMERFTNVVVDEWEAVFGAEDKVDVDTREGLRHGKCPQNEC